MTKAATKQNFLHRETKFFYHPKRSAKRNRLELKPRKEKRNAKKSGNAKRNVSHNSDWEVHMLESNNKKNLNKFMFEKDTLENEKRELLAIRY